MEQKEEKKIKNKRLSILLLQCAIVIGCIIIFYILFTPKDRVKDTTYSYSKVEKVEEYEIQGEYITRVRPLTQYKTFKETAEYTLNNNEAGLKYTVKVYLDSNKTQEVTEGYIKSGMVLEGIPNIDNTTNETGTYTISVIGDFTKDGDITISELTKVIKGVVGLSDWVFTEEEKLIADFNGDKDVNVVDIEECINYIVYGRLTLENGTKLKATDEYGITWNYTYQNGEATNVYYDSGELEEEVRIPNTLDGYLVVDLYNSSVCGNIFAKSDFASDLIVKKVFIPHSVTSIEAYAFSGCSSLTSIHLPDSVISIEYNAFSGCSSLEEIKIPDTLVRIGSYAFSDTAWYNNQPDGLLYIGKVAYRYKGSMPQNTVIELREGTKGIAGCAFMDCNNLAEIIIPDSVMCILGSAFSGTAWYNNQPDGLVYAGKVAYEYKGEMPSNNVIKIEEGTKTISEVAFNYDDNLMEIILPDSVVRIEKNAFCECSNLTTVTMSKNIEHIGEAAFAHCINLSNIIIWNSVQELGYRTFDGWKENQTINVEADQIPQGWDKDWDYGCNAKIVYGYTGE